ncbi:GNAT family N-acetyltransferase [Paenibacillus lycopersici]|uniref:GNAT family N-acetyltransferase n=1 Tax=Paenibacillus lycopersici TaxID=2704462 RepID=A0A6C0FZX2_9BACL|nr:GNAT family N-acetyltransferase [Paenibacillus lycopersici]QHT61031.1 GNAT family N-acetyltransferase [Paenibacillus lycopersici]
MEVITKSNHQVTIRPFEVLDFDGVQQLNLEEGWSNLVGRGEETKEAWLKSNIKFVVTDEANVIGYVRGFTDTQISIYLCELLIKKEFRGLGIATVLLQYVHSLYPKTRMELLATKSSRAYYEKSGYRSFYGFRKTLDE